MCCLYHNRPQTDDSPGQVAALELTCAANAAKTTSVLFLASLTWCKGARHEGRYLDNKLHKYRAKHLQVLWPQIRCEEAQGALTHVL